MAKAKDLAGLAALGALGYMLNKKSYKEDAGEQKTSSYTKEDKKVEAKDVNYGNEGRRTSMGVAPAPKTTTKAAPKLETITTRKDPRLAEAGMSRGTRTMPNDNYSNEGRSSAKPQSTVSSSEEGMKNYKPRRTPSASSNTVSSSEEGMKNYKPRRITPDAGAGRGFVNPPSVSATDPRSAEAGMSRGTRTTSMAGAGRGFVNPPVPKPADPRSAEAGMSRGTRNVAPGPGQADIDRIRRIQEASRIPSSNAGRPGYDEAGNPMKKGGMVKKAVKKMASGGMTSSASKRADGIATKGKTKCKMY
jgi:hypothetical protein